MSSFVITEHISSCQHIREYSRNTNRGDAVLRLAVKEYTPRRTTPLSDAETAVTIIASHGNGFPKESYEAIWDDLLKHESASFKIRSIWIADVAHQGASYALNKDSLGDEYNWLDHSRDLLLMINQFRDRMKPPFVGLAHSLGCVHLAWLSIIHPQLFHSLILIEPIILKFAPKGGNAAKGSSFRWDKFPSRAVAEAGMRKNPFFKSFDPRVLEAYFKHSLVDKPDGSVELATPKAQEAWSYLRANFQPLPEDESEEAWNKERLLNPDYTPFSHISKVIFTRPEGEPVIDSLPHLRPRTLFMYGERSHISHGENRDMLLSTTGAGRGGSGGVAHDAVHCKIYDGLGHLCCFEAPTAMATDVAHWLDKEMVRWRDEQAFYNMHDPGHSKNGGKELSDQWLKAVRKDPSLERMKKTGSKL